MKNCTRGKFGRWGFKGTIKNLHSNPQLLYGVTQISTVQVLSSISAGFKTICHGLAEYFRRKLVAVGHLGRDCQALGGGRSPLERAAGIGRDGAPPAFYTLGHLLVLLLLLLLLRLEILITFHHLLIHHHLILCPSSILYLNL